MILLFSELINDGGALRTALGTPGLLKSKDTTNVSIHCGCKTSIGIFGRKKNLKPLAFSPAIKMPD